MRNAQRYVLALLAVFVVSACAQLGLTAPQTPTQKVAAGYSTAEAINRSATALLNAKKMSSADAQHVLNSTRNARTGLDIAKSLEKVDPKAADAKIQTQIAILNALNAYLATKGK